MLDIKLIRENPELVQKAAKDKGIEVDIKKLLDIDTHFREISQKVQQLREERNVFTRTIKGKPSAEQIEKGKKIKEQLEKEEKQLQEIEKNLHTLLLQIPNLPKPDVKVGRNETENQIIKEKTYKEPTIFNFTPKDHLELGQTLNIIDIITAAKVSGTRFAYLKNEAVLLEFALIQFALEVLTKEGFIPVMPPVLIKQEITQGLGYWQAGGNEDYYVVYDPICRKCELNLGYKEIVKAGLEEKLNEMLSNLRISKNLANHLKMENADMRSILNQCPRCDAPIDQGNLYLVGTAEHAVVPMHLNETLDAKDLPKRYVGFSTAFRREAGSYGKDTKGILRVHQFDKIEMVSFVEKGKDDEEHEYLLSLEEKLFQALDIPYQVVKMCTGDLGFPAARKYDIEAWMPGQNKYREVTSVSTVTDFQARRLKIKYRIDNTTEYVSILNGTAFAIGRTIISIIENYQQEDGSVIIPEVLRKYIGKDKIQPQKK